MKAPRYEKAKVDLIKFLQTTTIDEKTVNKILNFTAAIAGSAVNDFQDRIMKERAAIINNL